MRTKRIEAAKLVAARLFEAERAIDLAASRIAELNAAMPLARLDANMSAMIGQDAFESSTDALTLLAKARERMVNTHIRLKAATGDLGIAEVSFGDSIKPPSPSAGQTVGGHLRMAS
ncbi:hypothetical protein [Sphingomonas oryzagri]